MTMNGAGILNSYLILLAISCRFPLEPGAAERVNINVAVLLPTSAVHSFRSAFWLALKEVYKQELIDRRKWSVKYKIGSADDCSKRFGIAALMKIHEDFNGQLDAIVGELCSVICEPAGLMAAAWNIPFVSYGCRSHELQQRDIYPTFSSANAPFDILAPFIREVFANYGWRTVGIIANHASLWSLTANGIRSHFEANGMKTTLHIIKPLSDKSNVDEARLVVSQLKHEARIIIVLMYPTDVMTLFDLFYDEGMLGEERYVFLGFMGLVWLEKDQPTLERKYSGYLVVDISTPGEKQWHEFQQHIFTSMNSTENLRGHGNAADIQGHENVPFFSVLMFHAVLMWAHGLNHTLQRGGSYRNGTSIAQAIGGLTFNGPFKKDIMVNKDGFSVNDHTLFILNSVNGKMTMLPLYTYHALSQKVTKLKDTVYYWRDGTRKVPKDYPGCGWDNPTCRTDISSTNILVAVGIAAMLGLILIVLVLGYRKFKFENELNAIESWRVAFNDIEIWTQGRCENALPGEANDDVCQMQNMFGNVGVYKGTAVMIKYIDKPSLNLTDRKLLLEMKIVRDLNQENINPVIGACPTAPTVCILTLYAHKGSLQDMIHNEDIKLPENFKLSICSDIAKGMHYLHTSPLGSHGHLTSANCVVDSRWSCKITDYGLTLFKAGGISHKTEEQKMQEKLWVAPEILREEKDPVRGTPKGDVYSFAIIMQEVVLKDFPYAHNDEALDIQEILNRVMNKRSPPYRPRLPVEHCNADWRELMESCWQEDAEERPSFEKIKGIIRQMNSGKDTNVVDNMIIMLEKQAEHLEYLVSDRTRELDEEKKKVEQLLYSILPESVANQLKRGKQVAPKSFNQVTIYFSDIVGFTDLCATVTPLVVIDLLNALYTLFDAITEKYDVYKVETIGDAYMVVSGLPVRNGDAHVSEIATMALHLLSAMTSFRVPNMPHKSIKLRIGIHTGGVVAGVVGLKMPRYCLFGDTVNTASRMESCGQPSCIHISDVTANLLTSVGGFLLKTRGPIVVKGKGTITTSWLLGKENFNMPLPTVDFGPDASTLATSHDDQTAKTEQRVLDPIPPSGGEEEKVKVIVPRIKTPTRLPSRSSDARGSTDTRKLPLFDLPGIPKDKTGKSPTSQTQHKRARNKSGGTLPPLKRK